MRPLLLSLVLPVLAIAQAAGPDAHPQPGVPRGAVAKHSFTSRIFPGTVRDYWVYVPAQYTPAKPACVMVVQDGEWYVKEDGAWRMPVVFDNLIHRGEMPVTIGIFINPGVLPAADPQRQQNRYNRSYEYDGLGDRYARFLIDEILPEVGKQYKLSSDPNDRAIAGASSGGIAAFNAAWERPDAFRRVLSFIGSYTNLRGGDALLNLIRKTEPKPIRVFLQDGSKDLNIYAGNWWIANQSMASSLEFAGYDVKFATGTGGHDSSQGAPLISEALRWLWREYPRPVAKRYPQVEADRAIPQVDQIVDQNSDWELVSEGHKFTEAPAVDRNGTLYFADIPSNQVFKLGEDGRAVVFRRDTGGTAGLMFGSDGRLYSAQTSGKRIAAWSGDGSEKVLADGVNPNDLAVTSRGAVYFTEPSTKRVWLIEPSGAKRVVHEGGIGFANGVRLSPDESLLYVADSYSRWVWSFQVQPDGSLAHAERFFHLEMPDDVESGPLRTHADGIALDTEGFLYVATNTGIQICDQPGRVVAILNKPDRADPSNVVFGGPDMQTLYLTAGDKVWRRHLRRKGFHPWEPLKPPQPRL